MKISRLLLTAALGIAASAAHADPSSGLGVGVHGLGSLYQEGSPRLTWVFNEHNALEFTPTLGITNYIQSAHVVDSDLGLSVAAVHELARYGGLHVNALVEFGYERMALNIAGTSKDFTDYFRVGVGPDLEYFFPENPQLSLGARLLLRGEYQDERDYNSGSPKYLGVQRTVELKGEALSLHYYFGADSKGGAVTDERPSDSRYALGAHGIGTMYGNGNPFLEWSLNERNALEFTPIFAGQLNTPTGVGVDSSQSWGLNIAYKRQLTQSAGIHLNGFFEVAYSYFYQHATGNVYHNQKYHSDTIDLGVGPDVEYFIPAIPNLSVGARFGLRFTYYQYKQYNVNGSYGHQILQTEQLVGEGLSLKYHFGGSNDSGDAPRKSRPGVKDYYQSQ